jgi:hypothetical protein
MTLTYYSDITFNYPAEGSVITGFKFSIQRVSPVAGLNKHTENLKHSSILYSKSFQFGNDAIS